MTPHASRRAAALAALAVAALGCSCTSSDGGARSSAHEGLDLPVLRERQRPRARVDLPDGALYDLGPIPAQVEVRWPAPPRTTRTETIDGAEPRRVIDRAGTRVIVHGALEELVLAADDVEVRASPDARVEHLFVSRGVKRIRVAGGRYGFIELAVPAQFVPGPPEYRSEWLVEDVTIDGVVVEAREHAFFVRGRRVAIVNSRARAERCSVWVGDTGELQSEDLVLAGNRFDSAGPESTVRIVDIVRAVVVENTLSNTFKHDFRVHGRSDAVVFARNRLITSGIMVGSMPEDRIGSVWLLENELHHRTPSLLVVSPERVRFLAARDNRVFSDRWECFVCDFQTGRGWDVAGNRVSPYRPAPESWARR